MPCFLTLSPAKKLRLEPRSAATKFLQFQSQTSLGNLLHISDFPGQRLHGQLQLLVTHFAFRLAWCP